MQVILQKVSVVFVIPIETANITNILLRRLESNELIVVKFLKYRGYAYF